MRRPQNCGREAPDKGFFFAQAPTIVVLTQLDRKAQLLLLEETLDFSRKNVERLMPKMKQEALDFCLVKDEVIGPDKNTERNLRFAVVGGLTAQIPLLPCVGIDSELCRDGRKDGGGITTVERPTPTDRERGNGNVQAVADVYSYKLPSKSG